MWGKHFEKVRVKVKSIRRWKSIKSIQMKVIEGNNQKKDFKNIKDEDWNLKIYKHPNKIIFIQKIVSKKMNWQKVMIFQQTNSTIQKSKCSDYQHMEAHLISKSETRLDEKSTFTKKTLKFKKYQLLKGLHKMRTLIFENLKIWMILTVYSKINGNFLTNSMQNTFLISFSLCMNLILMF